MNQSHAIKQLKVIVIMAALVVLDGCYVIRWDNVQNANASEVQKWNNFHICSAQLKVKDKMSRNMLPSGSSDVIDAEIKRRNLFCYDENNPPEFIKRQQQQQQQEEEKRQKRV